MNNIGTIYNFNYLDCTRSYEYLSRALDIAEQNNRGRMKSIVCLNMATLFMVYHRHLNTEAASDNIMRVLDDRETISNPDFNLSHLASRSTFVNAFKK